MRLPAALVLILAATPASAHFGHVGEVAGHAHWIALGAAAVAAALAVKLAKSRKTEPEAEEEEDPDAAEEKAS